MSFRAGREGSEAVRPSRITERFPEIFKVISLAEHTTWGIGGPSAAAVVRTPPDLVRTADILNGESVSWTVLGRGSNTLAPSEGWDGAVVILSGELSKYRFHGNVLTAGGGAPLPSMAGAACSKGLDGLVFAAGIPGTAGGAVFMNAGAYGECIGDVISEVTVLTSLGQFECYNRDSCGFSYRSSVFQNSGSVIVSMRIHLSGGVHSPEKLRSRAAEVLKLRRNKFPLSLPNAGSVFKRPQEGPPPGRLIEECGLKGFSVGGAFVSSVHANFIENRGGATSDDVIELIGIIKEKVMKTTGIELHREIRMLGEN